MQGKKPSKILSLHQKEVSAKEKFNLDRKLTKRFDNMTNYFATSHYYSKKNPLLKSHPRYSNEIVNHLFSIVLIGIGCLIEYIRHT